MFTDIDECQLGICSQECNNTIGSYTCGCFVGYELAADKTSCKGKLEVYSPFTFSPVYNMSGFESEFLVSLFSTEHFTAPGCTLTDCVLYMFCIGKKEATQETDMTHNFRQCNGNQWHRLSQFLWKLRTT